MTASILRGKAEQKEQPGGVMNLMEEGRERQICHDEMGFKIISYKILKKPWPYIDHKLLKWDISMQSESAGFSNQSTIFFLLQNSRSKG